MKIIVLLDRSAGERSEGAGREGAGREGAGREGPGGVPEGAVRGSWPREVANLESIAPSSTSNSCSCSSATRHLRWVGGCMRELVEPHFLLSSSFLALPHSPGDDGGDYGGDDGGDDGGCTGAVGIT